MVFTLTKESMESLIDDIIDTVEFTIDRNSQFNKTKTILEDNGIVELEDD